MNLIEIMQRFPSDDDCRIYLERVRWPDGVTCSRCGHDKITRLKKRHQFTCAKKSCRYRFSVTSGTIMHGSHISLQKWFLAISIMVDGKKSVSSLQLHRHLNISKECCWHLTHRIREAMSEDPEQLELFKGVCQVDDYYHGGAPRREKKGTYRIGRGTSKQTIVGVVEKKTGRVRTAMTPNLKGKTLEPILRRWIDLPHAELHTDEMSGYLWPGRRASAHSIVRHNEWYVTPDGIHTNAIENAWSLFARSVMGSFHHISVKHLPRYLNEFDSRFNARHENGAYFPRILSQSVGRRLTMNQLVNGVTNGKEKKEK